jgi:hypothetical protein
MEDTRRKIFAAIDAEGCGKIRLKLSRGPAGWQLTRVSVADDTALRGTNEIAQPDDKEKC